MKSKASLSKTYLLVILSISWTCIVGLGLVFILNQHRILEEESARIRRNHIDTQKEIIRKEVQRAVDYIQYMRSRAEDTLKKSIRMQVCQAVSIADALLEHDLPATDRAQVQKRIVASLRNVRFNNGRGYLFIVDTRGACRLHPVRTDLEGKRIIDMTDQDGYRFVRAFIETAKRGEGFVTYKWPKPGSAEPRRKKSFVKRLAQPDWFIGAGEYLDDVEKEIQVEVLQRLETIRFGKDGYIFAGTWEGLSLTSPNKGRNMIDVTDTNGVRIVRELIAAAKKGGGFVRYVLPPFEGYRHTNKVSFVMGIPQWRWYVGGGVYVDDIEDQIAVRRAALKNEIRINTLYIIAVLTAFSLLAFFLSHRIARRLDASLKQFGDFFKSAETESAKIDTAKLDFKELDQIAVAANRMIDVRRDAQTAAKASDERYREIVEGTDNLVTEVDNKGRFTFVNEAAVKVFGLSPEACIGRMAFDFIHPEDREKTRRHFARWIADKKTSVTFENRQVSLSEEVRDMLWTINFHHNDDGDIVSIKSIARDITDRRKIEEALRISNARFQRIFSSEAIGIVLADLNGHITETNDAFLSMVDYSREDLPLDWFAMTPSDWLEQDRDMIGRIRQTKVLPAFEKEYLRKDGSRIPVMIVGVQLEEEEEKLLCFILDRTERKKVEEELKKGEATLVSIFKAAPVGIGMVVDRVVTYANDRLCRMTGYSREELVGSSSRVLYPSTEEFDWVGKEKYDQINQYGTGTVETFWRMKNGEVINILLSSTPISEADLSIGVTFTALDITERKRAEAELRENEEKYRNLVEMFPFSVSIAQERKIVFANSTCVDMFRIASPEGVIGRDIDKGLPDAEKQRLMDYARRRDRGDAGVPAQYEAVFQRDDGETFIGEVMVSDITYKGRPAAQHVIMDITGRKGAEEELARYRDHLKDLVEERTGELMRANERLQTEISERRKAEEASRQYAETQEVLVREVNHRVKNNLSAIIGMLHMEQDRAESKGMPGYLPVLRDLVGRIEGLSTVHSLLSASGWRPLDVGQLCGQVINGALKGLPLAKRIAVDISAGPVAVSSNQAHHLTLVINELTTNTMKYALGDRDEAVIQVQIRQDNGMLKIIFRDDGPGYPKPMLQEDYRLSSIGFELIRGIVTRSLGGEVALCNAGGAETRIVFENELGAQQKESG